jgi:hypothetical protein
MLYQLIALFITVHVVGVAVSFTYVYHSRCCTSFTGILRVCINTNSSEPLNPD